MKITAKGGRKDKIHIYIDGEYRLTVDEIFWFSCGYISGDEIDEEELTAFEEAAGSRRAFNSALNSLDYRDHSEKEIRAKLMRKHGAEYVDEAVEKLIELDLINDRRYAENYARELFEHKKFGKIRIKSELIAKGIASDIASETVNSLFEDEEPDNIQRIVDIIEKKYYNRMNDEVGRKKVFSALQRMGYTFSDIREAMSEFSEDEYYEEY
ncbi:MAG: RecX family transcriptional regulator [Clostridiaceae bacterium]|nr:RecX family transcriptional regulator [Clostridiaceae bacterium]MDY5889852.1 RecX family transcriptional regulator [Oscillospiraceae bacterium]